MSKKIHSNKINEIVEIKKENKIIKQWKENYSDYIIQFILFVIFAFLLNYILSNSLKPQTDIDVDTKVSKLQNLSTDYSIDLTFNNKANFAGEDFYISIWGITSDGWGSDYATSEHCKRIEETEIDYTHRFKIYCDFIPPKSKFGFKLGFNLNAERNESKSLFIEYWGKTTPYTSFSYHITS